MSEINNLDVIIMGREFRVSCSEDEQQALKEAVNYLNQRMVEIRDAGKVAGVDRIAIMAALNITHELLSLKVGGFDITGVKRRIEKMQGMLDQVINEQTGLF